MLKRIIGAALIGLLLSPTWAFAQCYDASDIGNVTPSGWSVTMLAPAPTHDDQPSYKYNPLNISAPTYEDGNLNSTWTGGVTYHHLWMDRWNGGTNKRSNPINPGVSVTIPCTPGRTLPCGVQKPCGIIFTSLNASYESFASKVDYDIGHTASVTGKPTWGYMDALTYKGDNGLVGMTHTQFVSQAATLCTGYDALRDWYTATNVVIWPDVRLVDVPLPKGGIEIDLERQDNPSVSDIDGLIDWTVLNLHKAKDPLGNLYNFQLRIYTNPINASYFHTNGVDPDYVFNSADAGDIFTYYAYGTASDQMNAELALVPDVPHSKLFWLVDANETASDIAAARSIAISQGLGGASFWSDTTTVCSPQWYDAIGAALGLSGGPARE